MSSQKAPGGRRRRWQSRRLLHYFNRSVSAIKLVGHDEEVTSVAFSNDGRHIASGDKDAAQAALRAAMPVMQRGVSRGVIHRNTAARKLSRMSARVKALG